MDYWDSRSQLTADNTHLLKKIRITGGLSPARNICFNLYSRYDSLFWNQDWCTWFVSLLWKPELTASEALYFSDVLEQSSANYDPQVKSSWPPVFVNKVVLEPTAKPIHLCIICAGFHTTTAGLSRCDRNFMAHRAENIYYLVLHRQMCHSLFQCPI